MAHSMLSPSQEGYDINWLASQASELYEQIFTQARKDLRNGRGSAYFWIACPQSSLYKYVSDVFDIQLSPGRVAAAEETARAMQEGGFPPIPIDGISAIFIDTSDATQWYGSNRATRKREYAAKLSTCSERFEFLEGAIVNGVKLTIVGRFARVFRAALATFLDARISQDFATESACQQAASGALKGFCSSNARSK